MTRIIAMTAVAFFCIVILPCIPRTVDTTSTVECTVIADYNDGHNETLAVFSYIPEIGAKINYGGMRYVVVKVIDYWYDGLSLITQYYICKVEVSR
jgi:hypothetical protein